MNRQIGSYNTGDRAQMSNLHLPVEVWNGVLGYMNKAELGRLRICCSMFNELAETCMRELVYRELQTQENPLYYILGAYPRGKMIDFFNYYMQHAIITQELLNKALHGYDENADQNRKSALLALCDMTEPKRKNKILLKNIEILNSAFQECRYCYEYWHHLSIMVHGNYDCKLLCGYVSLCEDALKKEKKTGDFDALFDALFRNITQGSQGNLSWLLEVLLKRFLIQLSIKNPSMFLSLIWDGVNSILSLNFHPERKKLLLDVVDKLTTSEDDLTASMAISTAIPIKDYSNEALERYLPLIENPKKSWADNVTHIIRDVLRKRNNLTQLQQAKLMDLVEQAVAVKEFCFEICTEFSRYEALHPSIRSRLLNLAGTYINAKTPDVVTDAIAVKLELEGCSNDNMTFCLPLLQALSESHVSTLYTPLQIILRSQRKTLSSPVGCQVIELATKFLEGDDHYLCKREIDFLLEWFKAEQGIIVNADETQINRNFVLNEIDGAQPDQETNQEIITIEWIIYCGTSWPAIIVYFLLLI